MKGDFKMSITARRELLKKQKSKYLKASKKEKSKILNHLVQNVEMDRNYVITLLSAKKDLTIKKLLGRKKKAWTYTAEDIFFVKKIWEVMDYACGQRFVPYIGKMIKILKKCGELNIPNDIANKIKKISAATADRRLKKYRQELKRRLVSTTRPGTLLKNQGSCLE